MTQDQSRPRLTNRRQLLAALGSSSIGLLAGCSGDGGEGDGGSGGNGGDGGNGSGGGDGGDGSDGNVGSDGSDGDSGDGSVDYPTEDITLVVPTTSGGGTDAYARLTESYWEEHLGGDVVIENRPGAGMIVGTSSAYQEDPDGHTMVTAEIYNLVSGQLGTDVEYDLRDMSHIGAISQEPNAFVVMDQSGVETWDDFTSNAPDLNFATNGRGSNVHINPLILGEMTGELPTDQLNFVHHEGTGETLAGLERGDATIFTVGTLTSATKVVQALEGASLFTVFAEEEQFGDFAEELGATPTYWLGDLKEMGIDNVEEYANVTVFRRFFSGPPGVSEEILSMQRDAFTTFIEDEEFLSHMEENGRPALNPAGHEAVEQAVADTFDRFEGGRIEDLIKQAWS